MQWYGNAKSLALPKMLCNISPANSSTDLLFFWKYIFKFLGNPWIYFFCRISLNQFMNWLRKKWRLSSNNYCKISSISSKIPKTDTNYLQFLTALISLKVQKQIANFIKRLHKKKLHILINYKILQISSKSHINKYWISWLDP